jgi:ABC-type spermidine/putrescine transport system permease subunit II
MMAVFNRFDHRLEEAARDMGADEWTVFKEITLPLITPGIVAGRAAWCGRIHRRRA